MDNIFLRFRNEIGVSQYQMADYLGVTQGAISFFELGVREPKVSTAKRLIRLAAEYGIHYTLEDVYPDDNEAA